MGRADELQALTREHRIAQVATTAPVVAASLQSWDALMDPSDLSGSLGAWVPVQMGLLQQYRSQSADLAGRYVADFRAEAIGDRQVSVVTPRLDTRQARLMLMVSGPIAVKQALTRGYAVDPAMSMARSALSLRMQQWALGGGRSTVRGTISRDRRARGYRRVTDGSPCAFCAMLVADGASRGEFRSPDFKSHRNCGCTMQPIYGDDSLTAEEETWIDAYEGAANAARAAGEKVTYKTVLPRMRRMHPNLFSDGVHAH